MDIKSAFTGFFNKNLPSVPLPIIIPEIMPEVAEETTQETTQERAFSGAQYSRQTSDWIVSPIKTNEELKWQLRTIVSRARDLAKNNSLTRKYLALRSDNIVGTGFGLKLRFKNDYNGKEDVKSAEVFEDNFSAWGKASNGYCTMCGSMGFVDFITLVDRTIAVDGECFVQVFQGVDNPYKFSLRIIDTLDIDVYYNVKDVTASGNEIILGIERDIYGRELAYWTCEDPNNPTYFGGKRQRIPADNIIHLFNKEFAGQARGISILQPVLLNLNMLHGYQEAELYAARADACVAMVIETQAGTPPMKLLTDNKGSQDNLPPNAPAMNLEPAAILNLPVGKTMKQFNPTHPGTNYDSFTKGLEREIAGALNVSYNFFASDLTSVNFSSLRSGALAERDNWIKLQDFLIRNFLEKIYSKWLQMFLLTDMAKVGKFPLPFSNFAKYNHPIFKGRRWSWIDPKKDAEGKILLLQYGLISPQQIIEEMGQDALHTMSDNIEWDNDKGEAGYETDRDKIIAIQASQYATQLPNGKDEIDPEDEDNESDEESSVS